MSADAAWSRLRRSRSGVVGLALVALVISGSLLGPLLDIHPALAKDVARGLSALGAPHPPSSEWPLGTDMLGRCVAARLLAGARVSLQIGALAALTAMVIGTAVGLVAGWAGGFVDRALMRLVDLVLAFPFLLIVLLVAALLRDTGVGLGAVFIVLGAVGWTPVARVVRAKVLGLRGGDLVAAARAIGAGPGHILLRHVLPNIIGAPLALGTFAVAQMILAESTLSFLGLGAPPPTATWGRMLAEGQGYMQGAPWLVIAPGAAILITALGFNLLGDGLRDALDPRGP